MTKRLFLKALGFRLSDLPEADVLERLNFYSEIIDDRVEDGITENEAIASIGTPDEIAAQIKAELLPHSKYSSDTQSDKTVASSHILAAAEKKYKLTGGQKATQIFLIALGSPIWLSIVASVLAVIISAVASIWAIIISLWACSVALGGGVIFGIGSSHFTPECGFSIRLIWIGTALFSAGLAILLFFVAKHTTKLAVVLTVKLYSLAARFLISIKNIIFGRRG